MSYRPVEPVGQRRSRIPCGSADPKDSAWRRAPGWKALYPLARPERHRAQPERHRADRVVSGSAWKALALRTQTNCARRGMASGHHANDDKSPLMASAKKPNKEIP